MLSPLFPHTDFLLTSIPLHHDGHMIRFAHIRRILSMHGPRLALELRVAEDNDVAGADFVKGLGGRIGEVSVDEGAVGAGRDGGQGGAVGFEEVVDEGEGGAVADDGVLLAFGRFGDVAAELLVGAFELVGPLARGRRRVLLLELDV